MMGKTGVTEALEALLVRCCAPTLAGIKTGNMFRFAFERREELTNELRRINGEFCPRGLCLVPLRVGADSALLYLFRPAALTRDLEQAKVRRLLEEAGYPGCQLGACLRCLRRRLKYGGDFPHEIGLFLSYPPEDVRGFIDNGAKNYKCCGHWKVYGDESRARRLFAQYDKCTESYGRYFRAGFNVARLAVEISHKRERNGYT